MVIDEVIEKEEFNPKEWVEKHKKPRRPNGRVPRIYRKCCTFLDALDVEYEKIGDTPYKSYAGLMLLRDLVVLVEENDGIIDGKEDDIDRFFDEQFGFTVEPDRSKFDSMCIKSVSADRHGRADFLQTYEWRAIRYDVLKANDGKCELCGRGKHEGVILNVDHIKPRATHPELALQPSNLQVLCGACNQGKGNRDDTDWREPSLRVLMGEEMA